VRNCVQIQMLIMHLTSAALKATVCVWLKTILKKHVERDKDFVHPHHLLHVCLNVKHQIVVMMIQH